MLSSRLLRLNDEDLDLPEPPKNKGKSQSSRFVEPH